LMDVVTAVAPLYPQLDRDLILLGAFVHDMGKVDELSYERGFAYTDEGQLIGHLVTAVAVLDRKVAEAEKLSGEPVSPESVLRLKHMIVSHHGEYEFGSPKLPMTLEAVALHLLDNLDAKLHAFHLLIRDDPNVDSPWTTYHANLGRKFYKGSKSD
jgi:3'-5' exoribonuclease